MTNTTPPAGTDNSAEVDRSVPLLTFEDLKISFESTTGTVDAVLGNQSAILYSLKDDERFSVVESLPTGEQLGMGVAPDKAQLGSAVNRAMLALRNDGTLAQLQEKWFGMAQEDYR